MLPLAVVPIRGFSGAKQRLAPVLDGPARAALAGHLAAGVLDALAQVEVIVVTSDPEAAELARSRRATVVADPGHSLDAAAAAGRTEAAQRGAASIAVVHADLPYPADLDSVLREAGAGVTLVPDRHRDGTNVLVLPVDTPFEFAYGPGSFARHCAEAERLGLRTRVVEDSPLAWDVDVPADLQTPAAWGDPPWVTVRCDG